MMRAADGFSCCGDYRIRGCEANAVLQRIDVKHLGRVVQMMIQSIDRELRTLGDEPGVQGFTFADFGT
jgi:hypothetical protein